MILVGLTMLRQFNAERQEWRDALDQRWVEFLGQCGLTPLYLPNDPRVSMALVQSLRPQGLLLTGGGSCQALSGTADTRDVTERVLLDLAENLRLPVLGVCRGMQVMLTRAGGTLERLAGHVGEHMINMQEQRRRVNSYHEYGFREAPDGYRVLALADDGVIEAVYDDHRRHTGIMWHPERKLPADPLDIQRVRHAFGVFS
ncbi:type 1 glutamine amidotransferase [Pseudomonas hunanensis]|uniref:type 1 glutamine amidotransferase n=1 Tax=Pseudomonas hunanensis TaxID=1247546 RepID=UPI0030DDAA8D